MRDLRKTGAIGLLAALALLSGGCNKEDPQRLAAVGRKLNEKFRVLSGHTHERVALRWQAARALTDDAPLETRVSARVRWEQALAGARIDVHEVEGANVELTGIVVNLVQQKRAVELAETTIGVQKVIDKLVVTDAKP